MSPRVSPRVFRQQRMVATMEKRAAWLEQAMKVTSCDPQRLAEVRDCSRLKPPAVEPLSAEQVAQQVLAVRLRNIETLCDEVRELVDGAGSAITVDLLESFASMCRDMETRFAYAVDAAAQRAGVVASAN